MSDKIIDYLQQLDLSEVEAKLYLNLLNSGPTSVRELAETIQIKRTTAYFYVDLLIEKGLIIKLVKGSKKLIAASDPEKGIKELVEKEVQKAKSVQTNFPDILKTLETTFPGTDATSEAEIRYYKGKAGVKKIYEEALQANELRSYLNVEIMKEPLPENEELFLDALTSNKKIKIFEIFQDTPVSRKQTFDFQKRHNNTEQYMYKFLPKGLALSASDVLIYDGKVAIVNVTTQLTGIVLRNIEYYNNSKELFDLIWRTLPEVQ